VQPNSDRRSKALAPGRARAAGSSRRVPGPAPRGRPEARGDGAEEPANRVRARAYQGRSSVPGASSGSSRMNTWPGLCERGSLARLLTRKRHDGGRWRVVAGKGTLAAVNRPCSLSCQRPPAHPTIGWHPYVPVKSRVPTNQMAVKQATTRNHEA
jgi:hypothetical protein